MIKEKKMRTLWTILILIGTILLTNCESRSAQIVVGIERIDTSGVFFSYEHNGEIFSGRFDLDVSEKDFYAHDSLKIKLNTKEPHNYKFVSVVKRTFPADETTISLSKKNPNQTKIYGYHQVDIKPLFKGAIDEYENDSTMFEYFSKKLDVFENYKKIGVYILINSAGKVELSNPMTKNEEELKIIKYLIDQMPDFSPPVHKGENVTVSYLIEIPISKMNLTKDK